MASPTLTSAEPSSSPALWATASKEWVILPKPKPGRKPKKEPVSQSSEAGFHSLDLSAFSNLPQGDTASRRTQNRAAQRAFRERKQSQLAELQSRIKSYEQGEIERSVALQKVAKRLKDENHLLREENNLLKARVAELEARGEINTHIMPSQTNGLLATDKKRSRDLSSPTNSHTPLPHVSKKTREDIDTIVDYQHDPFSADTVSSSSSALQYKTGSINVVDHFVQEVCSTGFSTSGNASSKPRVEELDPLSPFLTCGFCEGGTSCVCREIACPTPMEQSVDSSKFDLSAEEDSSCGSTPSNAQNFSAASSNRCNESTVLDKLPIYKSAVPLRRRSKGVPPNSIFPVHEVLAPTTTEATCSGDPNNCLACAGDSFGQSFCAAIGSLSATCACSAEMMPRCCGSSSRCPYCPSTLPSLEPTIPSAQTELMPTNDAWRKLKAHPNVQFADLTLLAEVVARKSACSGPQLAVSSTLHTLSDKSRTNHRTETDTTGPHQGNESPPPRLVPHDVLLECGRKRMRQVRTDGVRDALRLLDAKFS